MKWHEWTRAETSAEPRRSVVCVCGWGGVFETVAALDSAIEQHMAEGSEGCDHATQTRRL